MIDIELDKFNDKDRERFKTILNVMNVENPKYILKETYNKLYKELNEIISRYKINGND